MHVLVTGGGGFLGTAICTMLRARGEVVRSVSRGDYPHLARLGVEHMRGDLADDGVAERAVQGVDAIIHTAALAGIWGDEARYVAANVVATERLLAAARAAQIRRFVYTSTPSVVQTDGDCEGGDSRTPYARSPRTAYQRTKIAAEKAVLAAHGPDLWTVALRPRLIWGPGDPHIVPRLAERSRAGRLRRVGSDDRKVDSTFIDNAATAHICALDRLTGPEAACGGRAYFVSNGEPWPMWDLINTLLAASGAPTVERTVPAGLAFAIGAVCEAAWSTLPLAGEPPMTRFLARQLSTANWYDITETRRDLGWEPVVSMEQGLERLRRAAR